MVARFLSSFKVLSVLTVRLTILMLNLRFLFQGSTPLFIMCGPCCVACYSQKKNLNAENEENYLPPLGMFVKN